MMDDSRHILVVEDEPELREIFVDLLKGNHHYVTAVEDGQAGLEMIKKQSFSLILSDIRMPIMDGLTLFMEAKTLGVQTPFVFVTAFGDNENILKALRLGAFDFVRKPFSFEEFNTVVDRALEVGFRRNRILDEVRSRSDAQSARIEQDEKMIRLLEISNFKKRA